MARYQPHDKFFHKARAQGLPSRAAFKLEELIKRFKLVRAGDRVADLGCAPGGWLAILAHAAGPSGRVIGVDLARSTITAPNVIVIAGDIRDISIQAAAAEALGGHADLITSDLSPKLSGIAERDQAQSRELLESALTFARATLRPGGAMVAKVFMGAGFEQVTLIFKRAFARVELTRAKATRPGSSELYLIARDHLVTHVDSSGGA
ncbi:MAG: RlmE family RNA methyltransferase [Candidatus Binataceae bacterium]|jgi:23S rRNA (uridine2552-2'-O)-methyltransferase